LVEGLRDKLLEPDEKVRTAACKLYASLDYETALHHVSESQLREISTRVLDKKVHPVFTAIVVI
jgi:sister-chromatid-cohesion protein PDS5